MHGGGGVWSVRGAHVPVDAGAKAKITDFTKLFWANRGNHNELTSQKFLPEFTFEELKQAALSAQKNGAFATASGDLSPIKTPVKLQLELENLRASLFDPNFEPMITAKNPGSGLDAIQASSNTFYEGVMQPDLKDFHDEHPLNSRVVKGKDGRLHEEVYRAGTPDGKVAPGLYATYLKRANEYLARAHSVADPGQAKVIDDLIRYYQTGEPEDWLRFGTDWVQDNAVVDFVNGFVEIYRDARGAKASAQSFVSITDKPLTDTMIRLGDNANYFEERAPWDSKYKKQTFRPPVVKAIETLIETGDFSVGVIGDNLPNENEIHEKYGTKNFLFTSSTRALNDATGQVVLKEFAANAEIAERGAKYGNEAEDPDDRASRGHRARIRKTERPLEGRCRALFERVFLDVGRSARRSKRTVERVGSEAEGTGLGVQSRRNCESDVRQRSAGSIDAASSNSQGRDHRRRSPARPTVDCELHPGTHPWSHRPVRSRCKNVHPGARLREDARGRRNAFDRTDAHQGRRGLRRDQGSGGPVRRTL